MTDRLLLSQISVDVRDIQKQMQKAGLAVDTASRRMQQTWQRNTSSMARDTEQFGRDVSRAITAIGLAAAAGEIADLADAWTRAGNQIAAAGAAAGTAGVSLSTIADISRATRTEFEATATLYARLTRATGDLAVSQDQVIEATRLINQSFVAGGASAQEQASAVLQLSQALQSGVLQGDELRSLRETSPILLQAIAKEFGVAQGALKKLGAEGKLTSDRIFKAILNAAPEIEAQFSVTQSTVADSFTNLRTAAIQYVGEMNESLGVTAGFSDVVNRLADNFEVFADSLLIAVFLLGARGLGGALNNAASNAIGFFASIGQRRKEYIKGLEHQVAADTKAAKEAAKNVAKEEANLARLAKQRAALDAQYNAGSDQHIIQNRLIARAQKEVTDSEVALEKVLQKKGATSDQITQATLRRAAAEAKLVNLQNTATDTVKSKMNIDQQSIAGTARLKTATDQMTAAQMRAAASAQALAAAKNTLARAGKSVLAFFGGPIGLAITAAAAAMAYFQYETVQSERAVRNVNTALGILGEYYEANKGLAEEAAAAGKELTEELKAQKDAAEALAEIDRQNRRDSYLKGMEGAEKRVKKLRDEIGYLEGDISNVAIGFQYLGKSEGERETRLTKLREELEDMTKYLDILQRGFVALDAIDFEKPEIDRDVPISEVSETDSEDAEKEAERRAKAEARLAVTLRNEAEDLIDGIRETWRGYYEWKDEAIERELRETLDAIDKAAASDAEKIEARKMAEENANAQRRELHAEEMERIEEENEANRQAAQQEMDFLARIMAERDRMFGRFLTATAQEYAARRRDIEDNIADETRRTQALEALAQEEAEFRRLARQEMLDLDERSDAGAEIARVQEITQAKLAALQEGYDLELLQLEEFEALKREIIADSEAEIQSIRAASATMMLGAGAQLFGALTSLASTFAGEQSAIFKTLFLAEKAFALASAYVQMQLAIAKAAASAPPPFNAPAILAAKVTGAATIAGIIAQTAAGFKKGGYTGDGNPNDPAGIVHRGEYVFDAKAVKRIGKQNLEGMRAGRVPASTIPGAVSPMQSRSVSFGDMIINATGANPAEIMDSMRAELARTRAQIARDVQRGFPAMLQAENNRNTPRHKRG